MKRKIALLFTCEHASNNIPKPYAAMLNIKKDTLDSHCGFDLGAKKVCEMLAKHFKSDKFLGETSRLLVDLNRSVRNRACFSVYSKKLDKKIQADILETYYFPFRSAVESKISQLIQKKYLVFHVSVHSFTPSLNGKKRNNAIGLLYDSKRRYEAEFASSWRETLKALGQFSVRMNYPYLGTADGHTTALRKKFSVKHYVGLELEINQALLNPQSQQFDNSLISALYFSLAAVCQ